MERTVAITTFCSWTSYGSMLQAYALKRTLKNIGFRSYILIDRFVPTPETKCRIRISKNVKSLVYSILSHRNKAEIVKQYEKSNAFIRNNIDIIYYNNYLELVLNHYRADYYLAGSDQVFNPNNLSPGLFFDYISDKSKLLTYACSMGTTKVDSNREKRFSELVNNFSRISVREEDDIPVLKKYNPKAEYSAHIDPTFLLDAEEWREKEKEYDIKEKYILLYPLYWDNRLNEELKKLKKDSGIRIVGVFASGFNRIFCDDKLYDVGVDEFLWLVDHAEAVITSSFHGAAFATIFEKKLCVVTNPDMPSRLDNLKNRLGLKDIKINEVLSNDVDYNVARTVIMEEKARSISYLEDILNE